jgi:hypothetical protein
MLSLEDEEIVEPLGENKDGHGGGNTINLGESTVDLGETSGEISLEASRSEQEEEEASRSGSRSGSRSRSRSRSRSGSRSEVEDEVSRSSLETKGPQPLASAAAEALEENPRPGTSTETLPPQLSNHDEQRNHSSTSNVIPPQPDIGIILETPSHSRNLPAKLRLKRAMHPVSLSSDSESDSEGSAPPRSKPRRDQLFADTHQISDSESEMEEVSFGIRRMINNQGGGEGGPRF